MLKTEKFILVLSSLPLADETAFDRAKREIASQNRQPLPANRALFQAYQNLLQKKRLKPDPQLVSFLKKAKGRTRSGVAIVTSLTKPFPCPGQCLYCPQEAKMPKSYLASEPAAARAYKLKFAPYAQMHQRLTMLEESAHPTDKIEFIIKGGSFTSYPLKYQYWFVLESFLAANQRFSDQTHSLTSKSPLKKIQVALKIAQRKNEKATNRIIGLTIETRPDLITPEIIAHLRALGCTRVELGLQATDDKILKICQRGHGSAQTQKAIFLLRQAGFKVDIHFMPNLPGSTPKQDQQMYQELFQNPGYCPDMVKIYPCTVIKTAPLFAWLKQGKYKPYAPSVLFRLLLRLKLATPRYCRLSRIIRDIPATEIQGGNQITNLRESLQRTLAKENKQCLCLRCREIGRHPQLHLARPQLFQSQYSTIGGKEIFLSFEDQKQQAVFAFLRLRLPDQDCSELSKLLPETKNVAFIRELHTYGQLLSLGKKDKKAAQHRGLGKKLLQTAEHIAKKQGFPKIAIIAGIGVRPYYRSQGYRLQGSYMVKK